MMREGELDNFWLRLIKANHVVVATKNSPGWELADYTSDGVNDNVEIQNAINKVSTLGGGTVKLLEGTYNIGSASQINMKGNVSLIGQGKGSTKIIGGNTSSSVLFFGPSNTETMSNIRVSGLHVVEQGASTAFMFYGDGSVSDITIDNNLIDVGGSGGRGVHAPIGAGLNASRIRIKNNVINVTGSSTYGITFWRPFQNVYIEKNHVTSSNPNSFNSIALYGNCRNFKVIDNIVDGTPGHGSIAISPASYGEIRGNVVNAAANYGEGGIEIEWKSGHNAVNETSHDILVENNTVIGGNWGVYTQQRDNLGGPPYNITINHNTIKNSRIGIYLYAGKDIVVGDNTYINCGTNLLSELGVNFITVPKDKEKGGR